VRVSRGSSATATFEHSCGETMLRPMNYLIENDWNDMFIVEIVALKVRAQ
jgi:hypothetical protein